MLLLCSCSALIFREQLFQSINTLPCRRNSGKHPASDSGSRCLSHWMSRCQTRRGFARRRGAAGCVTVRGLARWDSERGWPEEIRLIHGKARGCQLLTQNVVPRFILDWGFAASPSCGCPSPADPYTTPRLLSGGATSAPGRQVMSLFSPCREALSLCPSSLGEGEGEREGEGEGEKSSA